MGPHWCEVAAERIKAGEPELQVLEDYGYVQAEWKAEAMAARPCVDWWRGPCVRYPTAEEITKYEKARAANEEGRE